MNSEFVDTTSPHSKLHGSETLDVFREGKCVGEDLVHCAPLKVY